MFQDPPPSCLSHHARSHDVFQHLLVQIISTGEKDGLVATVKHRQWHIWRRAFSYQGKVDATSSTPACSELKINL